MIRSLAGSKYLSKIFEDLSNILGNPSFLTKKAVSQRDEVKFTLKKSEVKSFTPERIVALSSAGSKGLSKIFEELSKNS